ncbi:MAG TPA: hypothetical protein VLC48_07865 [Gemmatimonadota bacterium]|nr:hypothetical protein [Gemmatimonadota bacterium]
MPKEYESKDRPKGKHDPETWQKMADDMWEWATALEEWGKKVRRDIIALEGQRDFLASKLLQTYPEYQEEFRRIAQQAHERVGLEGKYDGGDPDDPPPPPWKPR